MSLCQDQKKDKRSRRKNCCINKHFFLHIYFREICILWIFGLNLFLRMPFKKKLACISFCDMTKVQEIRENICTQKLVRLRYVLVLRTMLLQREFCFKKIASFRMVSIFFLFLSP